MGCITVVTKKDICSAHTSQELPPTQNQGTVHSYDIQLSRAILYISISKINRTRVESYIIYVELYTSLESVKEFGKFESSEEF